MGNVKIDSNVKLLIVLKIPSKFGYSFLQLKVLLEENIPENKPAET